MNSSTIANSTNAITIMNISSALLVSCAVVLLSLLVAGVFGNVAAIVSILRPSLTKSSLHSPNAVHSNSRRSPSLTTTNTYIVNLSAADLLFLLFCAPFQGTVYILNHWPYGWLVCKLAHFCQFCTIYASVWILTIMSIDRYAAIGHPLKSVKWRRSRKAVKVSAAIWLAAALLSSPWLFLYETTDVLTSTGRVVTACYDGWTENLYRYRKWLLLTVTTIGFLIPALVIFSMALLIAKSIRETFSEPLLNESTNFAAVETRMSVDSSSSLNYMYTKHHSQRQLQKLNSAASTIFARRRRVCWLVFGLALIFFVFQGPQNISLLWLNFDSSAAEWIEKRHQIFFVLRLLAHVLTYVNSVLNPLLYGLASGRIRNFLMGNRAPTKTQVARVMAAIPNAGSGLGARRQNGRYPLAEKKKSPSGKSSSTTTTSSEKISNPNRDSTNGAKNPSDTMSLANENTINHYDLRRTILKHAAMRRMSSTVSAFV